MQQTTQYESSRHERLLGWLRENGLRFQDVAYSLGVGKSAISRSFKAATIPTRRHAQLVALGIPAELLPAPLDITPGPKRKIFLPAIIQHGTELDANLR